VGGSSMAMPGWHNFGFLAAREIGGFCVVGVLYGLFVKLQPVSTLSPGQARLFRNVALLIPFAHVLFCTMVAWDFEMTLTPAGRVRFTPCTTSSAPSAWCCR